MRNALLTLSACLLLALICGCQKDQGANQTVKTATNVSGVVTNSAATAAAHPELLKLKGKWLRPDGDYILEIAEINGPGTIVAKYFNPNPINVSKALGMREGESTKIFVELQDTGYPGCTYSLTYDATVDQLFGQYYQAAMQQTYDVVFTRLKPE
jgi:hypothetical protein